MTWNLQAIADRYLGSQTPEEFLENAGTAAEYARDVFAGRVFGTDDPASPDLGINTEADLTEALEAILGQE